jgi:hypothetical protein
MGGRTYGTVSPEQQKAMRGLEFVRGLASGVLPLNTIAQTLGYDVVEAECGRSNRSSPQSVGHHSRRPHGGYSEDAGVPAAATSGVERTECRFLIMLDHCHCERSNFFVTATCSITAVTERDKSIPHPPTPVLVRRLLRPS